MAIRIDYAGATGQTLAASVRKITQATRVLGDWWNDTTGAFQAGQPAFADLINLTEGTGFELGCYRGISSAALATYSGELLVGIHSATECVATGLSYAQTGVEVGADVEAINTKLGAIHGAGSWAATTAASAIVVGAERTWRVTEADPIAPNTITEQVGVTATLAMDFSEVLNPGTSINSVDSVTDTSGNALVPTNLLVSQDRRNAHMDVTGLVADTLYTLKVQITSSDSQTILRTGRLRAE